MTPLTRYEQKIIIDFNVGEQIATVYTRDKAVMQKLDKFVANFLEVYKRTGQMDVDKTFSMPKAYVSYRKPRKLSDEQREQARQKMFEINSDDNCQKNNRC